jgi:hypothetical protein
MNRAQQHDLSSMVEAICKDLSEIAEKERLIARIWIALSFVLFFLGGVIGYGLRALVTP